LVLIHYLDAVILIGYRTPRRLYFTARVAADDREAGNNEDGLDRIEQTNKIHRVQKITQAWLKETND
jgi:hypothetical protein